MERDFLLFNSRPKEARVQVSWGKKAGLALRSPQPTEAVARVAKAGHRPAGGRVKFGTIVGDEQGKDPGPEFVPHWTPTLRASTPAAGQGGVWKVFSHVWH